MHGVWILLQILWNMVLFFLTYFFLIMAGFCGSVLLFKESFGPLCIMVIRDFFSFSFFCLLFLIAFSVAIWSYYYMDSEETFTRFGFLVGTFISSMVLLIFLASLPGAMIGWDGLGVTSFLLVIFYKNRKSLGSGMITAMTNRLGDCFFFVILGLSLYSLYNFTISVFLLLLISMTKSAQIPFSSWLPAAMAAPTPVSALVHSSTLVTAGIYLLIRFNLLNFEWMLFLGSLTLTMAGLCACAELDIKKIVALSTLSQCGVMMVALSLEMKDLCFFHLATHAMFKALLFMCAGVGIHTVFGTQDFRSFSSLAAGCTTPLIFLLVANLSLMGFPFLAGFFSKDLILESFYMNSSSFLLCLVFLFGVGLTSAYSLKLTYMAFFTTNNMIPSMLASGGFSGALKLPLMVLGFCAITMGLFFDFTSCFNSLFISDKLAPLIFIGAGFLLGIYWGNMKFFFLSNMWNLTGSAQFLSIIAVSSTSLHRFDNGWTELTGGQGISTALNEVLLVGVQFLVYSYLAMVLLVV